MISIKPGFEAAVPSLVVAVIFEGNQERPWHTKSIIAFILKMLLLGFNVSEKFDENVSS